MNQKKNKKIIIIFIIIVLILIIISGLGLAYTYLTTDIFKSDKELFFKYLSQMADNEDGFIDGQLKQYLEKQNSTPYSNNGKFNVSINGPQDIMEDVENTNNMDITFSGQVDSMSSKIIQDISINYSEDVKFPLSLKKIQDVVAIQTQYVGSKYITIDLTQLEDLNTDVSLNNTIQSLEEIQEISNIEFSEEEQEYIKDKYLEVISQNLQDSNFSNIENNNNSGYKLSLNNEEVKKILIQLLETLKEDNIILDKLNQNNENSNTENIITSENIENIIEELNETTIEEGNTDIIVYQENGKTSEILVQNQEVKIVLKKVKSENELQYNISLEQFEDETTKSTIYFNAKYSGLQTMQDVDENYELGIFMQANSKIISEAETLKESTTIAEEKERIALMVSKAKSNNIMQNDDISNINKNDLDAIKEDTEKTYGNINIVETSNNVIKLTFTNTKHEFQIDSTGKIISEPKQEEKNIDEFSETYSYQYNFSNNVRFQDTSNIEEFTQENSLNLNSLEEQQRTDFMNAVSQRLVEVNKKQMQDLGLSEDENPIVNMLPTLYIYKSVYDTIEEMDIDELEEQVNEDMSVLNNIEAQTEILEFNSKFELYQGTNIGGGTVKGLLTIISDNNGLEQDEDEISEIDPSESLGSSNNKRNLIEEINFNGEEYQVNQQTIALLKEEISTADYYKVEFEKNEDTGRIYRVVINKK